MRTQKLALTLLCPIVIAATVGNSSADFCDEYDPNGPEHSPQNVILIILDDTSAASLPGINRPIRWADSDSPSLSGSNTVVQEYRSEGRIRRPDLNRLAARVYATSDESQCSKWCSNNNDISCTSSGQCPGGACVESSLNPGEACLGKFLTTDPDTQRVIPADIDASGSTITPTAEYVSSFRYSDSSAGPSIDSTHHILKGFGGLGRLARDGIAYSRHYSTSGRCEPTRAAIMTGRDNHQVGVSDNGDVVDVKQIMITELLEKRGYRSGLVGKWHLTNGPRRSPHERGFQEVFRYKTSARRHNRLDDLLCSPVETGYATGPFFCTDPDDEDLVEDQGRARNECVEDVDCDGQYGCPTGACACAVGEVRSHRLAGHCYPKVPLTPCDPSDENACTSTPDAFDSPKAECRPWGKYIGEEPEAIRDVNGDETKVRIGCHPDDSHNPLCCVSKDNRVSENGEGEYSFRKERADGQRFWKRLSRDHLPNDDHPCDRNDVSSFDLTYGGCGYDTRYYTDAAVNFIKRNRERQPFFLNVSYHGTHNPSMAPKRTELHYDTKPEIAQKPIERLGYWGAIEEIDASIGQILSEVANDDLLKENTLVLLTADQGGANAAYGEPALTGGKGKVEEGGVRVGLHAWWKLDGADGVPTGVARATALQSFEKGVTSHVDIFATIAHAAGCRPNADGGYTIKSCNDPGRAPCETDGDCTESDDCVTHHLAGRSILPQLSPTVAGYNEGPVVSGQPTAITTRNFAFAQYSGSGSTIVAREGLYAVGICGVDNSPGEIATGAAIERVRRAASTTECDPSITNDCNNSSSDVCVGIGQFCVPQGLEGVCTNGDAPFPDNCTWKQFARCDGSSDCCTNANDCGGSTGVETCRLVRVRCEQCFDAQLKVRGNELALGNGQYTHEMNPTFVFDLRTNPTEQDVPESVDPGYSLNMGSKAYTFPTGLPNSTKAGAIEELRSRLGGWIDCVRDVDPDHQSTDCESLFEEDE